MTTEMVDRVALAIRFAREQEQDSWGQARAALEAMREPTGAMVDAAYALESDSEVPEKVYPAMIDAALGNK